MTFLSARHPMQQALGAGINLKPQHFHDASLCDLPNLWFEVHTENYLSEGGPRLAWLRRLAEKFPISLHGVGGSLGSEMNSSPDHLKCVRELVRQIDPVLVSEHATWSGQASHYFSELLPLPRTKDALTRLCAGVQRYQDAIGRPILIENAANYLHFVPEMAEPDFLMEVCQITGCGLLVDLNNLYVSAFNTGVEPKNWLSSVNGDKVGELHIAGYDADEQFPNSLLIDSHASEVSQPVWELLVQALKKWGPKPVLLERDEKVPVFSSLLSERKQAQHLWQDCVDRGNRHV